MHNLFAAGFSISLSGFPALIFISILLSVPIFLRYGLRYRALKARINTIKKRNTVVTQYSAPLHIPPAFFGVLVDNRISIQDMIATVLELVVKGNLVLSYDENQADYYLKTTDLQLQTSMKHEQYIYSLISSTPTKNMPAKSFSAGVMMYQAQFTFALEQDLQREGYYFFDKNMDSLTPGKFFNKTVTKAIFMGLIKPWNWPGILLSLLIWPFGIAWLVFSLFYYNRLGLFKYKTKKWEEQWPEMSGYYNYLQVVEAEKRAHALEATKNTVNIEKHDPFLVAAQLQKHWSNIFSTGRELGGGGTEYNTYKRT